MGDDVPLPVLASTPHMLYDYFKQRFAQARGLRLLELTLLGLIVLAFDASRRYRMPCCCTEQRKPHALWSAERWPAWPGPPAVQRAALVHSCSPAAVCLSSLHLPSGHQPPH